MELFFELERVGVILKLLKKRILMPVAQIEEIEWGSGKRRPLVWQPFQKDQLWGGRDVWCWFRFPVEIPENLAGKRVEIRFSIDRHRGWDNAGSQFLVYRDGEIVQGVDGNHRTVTLTPSAPALTVSSTTVPAGMLLPALMSLPITISCSYSEDSL